MKQKVGKEMDNLFSQAYRDTLTLLIMEKRLLHLKWLNYTKYLARTVLYM